MLNIWVTHVAEVSETADPRVTGVAGESLNPQLLEGFGSALALDFSGTSPPGQRDGMWAN